MELPVITFIQARLAEADPKFETRVGTAHYALFVSPQQFMLQPLVTYQYKRMIAQSVRLMLQDPTPDTPTTFVSDDVDNNASNLYVTRDAGNLSFATVRVEYTVPKDLEFPALTAQFTAGSLNFFNSSDFTLTAEQMALQSDGSLFYADIPVQSEAAGAAYNVAAGAITAILNDPDAVLVTNLSPAADGITAETNTQLLNRIPNSIAVRDLETTKGINAILTSLFPFLQQIVSIGMGDPEMQRDIEYNIHLGAHTDVYLKTPNLTTSTSTFIGLTHDTTRDVPRSLHLMMARSETDPLYPAFTGTASIDPASVVVTDSVIETSAQIMSLPMPALGFNLSTAKWLNITVDATTLQVYVAGSTPGQTQLSEIIANINFAFGVNAAVLGLGGNFVINSQLIGAGSQVSLNTVTSPLAEPTDNAATALFGGLVSATGVAKTPYVRDIDYTLDPTDDTNGYIFQTTFSSGVRDPHSTGRRTITSGQTMINLAATGTIDQVGSNYYFDDASSNAFTNPPLVYVQVGDLLTISAIGATVSGTVNGVVIGQAYPVAQVVSANRLVLSGFSPTAPMTNVTYSIVSEQVVNISYNFNPISIDIGAQVLLADGLTRGIRPGRSAYTITNTPFVKIISIQQIDPATSELIGSPLNPPTGYGGGGYGRGGYGVGLGGDYMFIVNDPPARFSVFEDSMIVFSEAALGLSYQVTYYSNPELQAIHAITRDDSERVTGADVLVKSMIPAFVDIPLNIRRDSTNANAATDAQLLTLVQNLINSTLGTVGISATAVEEIFSSNGVPSVQTPFTMTATVNNPDGSTSIYQSTDVLKIPTPTLPSQTNNYTTARITGFWAGNVVITDVT